MNIEGIRDIVRVVRKYDFSSYDALDFTKLETQEAKIAKFYQLLRDEAVTDTEIKNQIYQGKNASENYKTLKSYFVSRMLNNITFFDLAKEGISEHTRAIFKGYKYLFVVSVLVSLGSRSGAIHFARKVLKLADHYELHFIAITLLEELRRHSMQLGKRKEYEYYLEQSRKRLRIMETELEIKALQEQISIHFTRSFFVDDAFRKQVHESLNRINDLLSTVSSYFGTLSYYRVLYISRQIDGFPLKSAEACDEAISFMRKAKHMSPPSRLTEFGVYKLENYVLARDYESGKQALSFCEHHVNTGMNLWFTVKEFGFLLMMQTHNFDGAETIYREVIANTRFRAQLEHVKERWDIFGLHINYVMRVGKSEGRDDSVTPVLKRSYLLRTRKNKEKVFYSRYYAKDKRGLNVAILIMNVLLLLEDNKKDILIERVEALSSYRFKYLNSKHCHQSFILFKLIRLMIRCEFDLARIEKKSGDYEASLNASSLGTEELFEYIQILPHAWVWNRMKTILASR